MQLVEYDFRRATTRPYRGPVQSSAALDAMHRGTARVVRIAGVVTASILSLISCSDGRPGVREVRGELAAKCPSIEIESVSITEDEVVARSFKFTYRERDGSTEPRTTSVQYMEVDGVWQPAPPLSDQAPEFHACSQDGS
jgi:hypothetical protein